MSPSRPFIAEEIKLSWLFIILTFIYFNISSCNSSKAVVNEDEDFDTFYDKFHSNEVFQLERIAFPIEGGSAEIDGIVPWTKDNWISMKVKIYDIDQEVYDVTYDRQANSFIQTFQLKGSNFGAEYRFQKKNGKWYLIYALDRNL